MIGDSTSAAEIRTYAFATAQNLAAAIFKDAAFRVEIHAAEGFAAADTRPWFAAVRGAIAGALPACFATDRVSTRRFGVVYIARVHALTAPTGSEAAV